MVEALVDCVRGFGGLADGGYISILRRVFVA